MKTDKIFDESGQEFVRSFSSDVIEKVNPVEYFKNYELQKRAIVMRDLLSSRNPFLTSFLDDSFFLEKAKETLVGFFEEMEKTPIHPSLKSLLITEKKKEQIRLLKGVSLNPDQLLSLIFKAYNEHGYLFSRCSFEHLPNGLEGKKLPKVFRLTDQGTIEKFGETDLTEGELKNVILNRKVIVANFLETQDNWHCFFITYNSIGGKESWKNGQAHFHYISSSFGPTKQEFIDSMRTGKYRSTPVHIDLLEYGNQPGSNI